MSHSRFRTTTVEFGTSLSLLYIEGQVFSLFRGGAYFPNNTCLTSSARPTEPLFSQSRGESQGENYTSENLLQNKSCLDVNFNRFI